MNRIVIAGVLAFAGGCNLPLIMLEIEAPEVCVTNVVDIDATDMAAGVSGTNELPSEMAAKLAASSARRSRLTTTSWISRRRRRTCWTSTCRSSS